MQCRAPAGGWRRPAPSEREGGSSAGRGRELPARRRGRGRPPRAVASRRRRPARLLPAAQSASSAASAGEGRARRRRACSLLAWRRGARRRRSAGASWSRALPRALSAPPFTRGGGVHASARAARTKSAAGTLRAGPCRPWPRSQCLRGRGRGRRLAGPPCRGVASGLSPPPERGCPLDYPPRRLGPGASGAASRGHPQDCPVPSACGGPARTQARTRGQGP